MGFLSGIFGSKDKPPKTEVKTLGLLDTIQRDLLDFIGPTLQNRVASPVTPNALESTSLQGLEDLALNIVNPQQQTATQQGRAGLTDIINRGPTDFEDFFATTVRDPALQEFQEDVLPAIHNQFAGRLFGGERVEAEGRAREDLLDSLTRSRSDLAFQTRQQDTQNKLAALGLLPQFDERTVQTDLLSQLLTVGGGHRESIAGEESNRINQLLAAIGIPTKENIVINQPGQQGQEGIFPSLAKLAVAKGLGVF